MSSELAELVRRNGGIPTCAPAVKEVALHAAEHVALFIDACEQRSRVQASRHVAVFLTGAGATALFREAQRQGRLPSLVRALARDTVICRGPKPSAVLRQHGISPMPHVADPYTTDALLQAMEPVNLNGVPLALVHYGERSELLADALKARGALLDELCLYEWKLPDDVQPLEAMVRGLVAGEFDALVCTSQIQCRHLLQIATGMQMDTQLLNALRTRVVVAAIGPTCKAALETFGVTPQIVPNPPKMGPLVIALASYFATLSM
jgi:uroporphyrinogen-III synthase